MQLDKISVLVLISSLCIDIVMSKSIILEAIYGMTTPSQPSLQLQTTLNPIVDLSYKGSDAVRHKLQMLNSVQETVDSLFQKTQTKPSGQIEREVFNQLRVRCTEKILNLR